MDFLGSVMACLTGHDHSNHRATQVNDKAVVITGQPVPYSDDEVSQFIEVLRTADCSEKELEKRLKSIISTNGLKERIAERILEGIEKLLNEGAKVASAMDDAMKKATDIALDFANEHPYYTALIAAGTIIALGVLVMLCPWVLEALGFARLGPRGGSFAAKWMSRIARLDGRVSKGSIYAYLQRLGMVWKK
ncbi:Fc.00g032460.m01.CDS01 [Cosmosporella sp. VM-42]